MEGRLTALAKRLRIEFSYQKWNHPNEDLVQFPQAIVKLHIVWTSFIARKAPALALCYLDYVWNVAKCAENLVPDLLTLSSQLIVSMSQRVVQFDFA